MRANHQTSLPSGRNQPQKHKPWPPCTQPGPNAAARKEMAFNAGRPSDVDGYYKLWQADVSRVQTIAAKMLKAKKMKTTRW